MEISIDIRLFRVGLMARGAAVKSGTARAEIVAQIEFMIMLNPRDPAQVRRHDDDGVANAHLINH